MLEAGGIKRARDWRKIRWNNCLFFCCCCCCFCFVGSVNLLCVFGSFFRTLALCFLFCFKILHLLITRFHGLQPWGISTGVFHLLFIKPQVYHTQHCPLLVSLKKNIQLMLLWIRKVCQYQALLITVVIAAAAVVVVETKAVLSIACPRGLAFSWWGCYGLCLKHKPAELAHSSILFLYLFQSL